MAEGVGVGSRAQEMRSRKGETQYRMHCLWDIEASQILTRVGVVGKHSELKTDSFTEKGVDT